MSKEHPGQVVSGSWGETPCELEPFGADLRGKMTTIAWSPDRPSLVPGVGFSDLLLVRKVS